jgi:hypothetical protein
LATSPGLIFPFPGLAESPNRLTTSAATPLTSAADDDVPAMKR